MKFEEKRLVYAFTLYLDEVKGGSFSLGYSANSKIVKIFYRRLRFDFEYIDV